MSNGKAIALMVLLIASPHWAAAQTGLTEAPTIQSHAWTASDNPYEGVREQIKNEYAQGNSLKAIAEERRAIALSKPKDPVAQFAWVCAERGAIWVSSSEGAMPRYLLDTLTRADPGNVHEYTRYRFCMTDETDLVLPIEDVERLGKRLLAYNPKDDWVRLSLINMLSSSDQDGREALPYALEWVRLEPSNSKAHSSLAQIYFKQWEQSGRRSKRLGDKAIAEYQGYLSLSRPDDSFRRHAQSFITHIQQARGTQR